MWNGKRKALTFSFDDGVRQDRRTVELLNKYGLKATFNINSGYLGVPNRLIRNDVEVDHTKVEASEVGTLYRGHEVAVHTLTHPGLYDISDETLIRQVEEDRRVLSELAGYSVEGMAYPFGHCNRHIADVIGQNTGVRYARTVNDTKNFDLQEDLLLFNPTVYYIDVAEMFRLGEEFLALTPDCPKLFYVWGHAYEFDINQNWERIEQFCQKVGGQDDVWYATNIEIYDYVQAYNALQFSAAGNMVKNPSALTVWFTTGHESVKVEPGETVKFR